MSSCRMDRDRSEWSRFISLAKPGSPLLVLKLDDDFDGDTNDVV